MENKEHKDLGWMNSWTKTPPEFKACALAGHSRKSVKKGNCWHEYTCEICKIRYDVDSSD